MAQGSLRWAAAAVAVIVGGCTGPAQPPPAAPPAPEAAPAPSAVAPPPQALGSRDTCRADPLQYLIGHPHTDIPVPVNPNLRRVVCSSCVVTQDFNPSRQTIVYDSQSGLVRSVKCG